MIRLAILRLAEFSGDLFDLPRRGRAYDRFGDSGTVNHLVERYRIRRSAACRSCKGIQRRAADVLGSSLPDLRLALSGLELARPEQTRATFLRRRAGHMSHAFEPHPALGPENLEAESGPGRGERAEIARHPVLHAEQDRRRVVGVDLDRPPKALAIDMVDHAAQIDHGVDGMNAHGRQATAWCLVAVRTPLRWLEQQRVGKRHRRLDMHDGAEPARTDALPQARHFRVKAAIVAEPEHGAGLAHSCDRSL